VFFIIYYFHRDWLLIVLIDRLTRLIIRILILINTLNIQISNILFNKMKKNKQSPILLNDLHIIMKSKDF